jgi:hypothetical protein
LPTGIPSDLVAGRVDPHHRVVFAAGHPDGVGAKRHLVGGVRELDPLGHPAGAGGDAADGPVAGGGDPGRPAVTGDGQPGRWVGRPDPQVDLVGERVDAGHQPAVLGPAATHTASGEAARAIGLASTVMGVASVSRAARATCR